MVATQQCKMLSREHQTTEENNCFLLRCVIILDLNSIIHILTLHKIIKCLQKCIVAM